MFRDLQQAVWDALPLDFKDNYTDKARRRLVVRTIFKIMAEGIKRDGFVTIEGLGRFYLKTLRAKDIWHRCSFHNKAFVNTHFPAKVVARFRPVKTIRSDVEDKDA